MPRLQPRLLFYIVSVLHFKKDSGGVSERSQLPRCFSDNKRNQSVSVLNRRL